MTTTETAPATNLDQIKKAPGILLYTRIRKSAFFDAKHHPYPLL